MPVERWVPHARRRRRRRTRGPRAHRPSPTACLAMAACTSDTTSAVRVAPTTARAIVSSPARQPEGTYTSFSTSFPLTSNTVQLGPPACAPPGQPCMQTAAFISLPTTGDWSGNQVTVPMDLSVGARNVRVGLVNFNGTIEPCGTGEVLLTVFLATSPNTTPDATLTSEKVTWQIVPDSDRRSTSPHRRRGSPRLLRRRPHRRRHRCRSPGRATRRARRPVTRPRRPVRPPQPWTSAVGERVMGVGAKWHPHNSSDTGRWRLRCE